jgi:hypothetical protein
MRKAGAMTAKVTFKVGPYFRYWWGLSERATVATAALDHKHKLSASKPRKQRHPKEITDGFQGGTSWKYAVLLDPSTTCSKDDRCAPL